MAMILRIKENYKKINVEHDTRYLKIMQCKIMQHTQIPRYNKKL